MTERSTVRISGGADTVEFGRGGYVLHDLDIGAATLAYGMTTAREITFSGYILPEGTTAAARTVEMERLARRLRRMISRPEGFTLAVDDRHIALTATRAPVFAHEAPLMGDEASFFTVYAVAKDPAAAYFQADTEDVTQCRGWLGKLIFPLAVTEETLFGVRTSAGTVTVDNPGDVDCGFIATVTAEGGDITAVTLIAPSGERIALSYPLADGQSLIIDTRRGHKSVTAGGAPILDALAWNSAFFALAPGENPIGWQCEGEGSVVLRISLTPLYL